MHGNAVFLPPRAKRQNLSYRRDIDGLRAVAVLAVLGYHFQISWFSGGFVGVDVFFVISGYLIGSLILQDVKLGAFSLFALLCPPGQKNRPGICRDGRVCHGACVFPAAARRISEVGLVNAFCGVIDIKRLFFQSYGIFRRPRGYTSFAAHVVAGCRGAILPCFSTPCSPHYAVQTQTAGLCLGLLWIGSFALSAVGAFESPQSTFFLVAGARMGTSSWRPASDLPFDHGESLRRPQSDGPGSGWR